MCFLAVGVVSHALGVSRTFVPATQLGRKHTSANLRTGGDEDENCASFNKSFLLTNGGIWGVWTQYVKHAILA